MSKKQVTLAKGGFGDITYPSHVEIELDDSGLVTLVNKSRYGTFLFDEGSGWKNFQKVEISPSGSSGEKRTYLLRLGREIGGLELKLSVTKICCSGLSPT